MKLKEAGSVDQFLGPFHSWLRDGERAAGQRVQTSLGLGRTWGRGAPWRPRAGAGFWTTPSADTGVLLRHGGEGLPNTGPRGQQACTLGAWSRESGNRGDGICPLYSNRR